MEYKIKTFIPLLLFVTLVFPKIFSIEHKIQNGDNLWSISRKYNVPSEQIILINNLENSKLYPNTIIVIPDKIIDYTVEKSDNLSKIARDNNTSIKQILSLNQLKSDTIYAGQKLKIPIFSSNKSTEKLVTEYYTVKKGDSLYSISKKFDVSIENIKVWNQKKSESLLYGEKIKIYTHASQNSEDKPKQERFIEPHSNSSKDMPLPVEKGYIYNVQKKRRGVLIFLTNKSPIKSIDEGVVEFIGHISGYRNVLIVKYGQFHYVYGSLNQILVKENERVKSDQIVGYASPMLPESSRESFFYLEIRNEKKIVDPYKIYPYFKDNYTAKK